MRFMSLLDRLASELYVSIIITKSIVAPGQLSYRLAKSLNVHRCARTRRLFDFVYSIPILSPPAQPPTELLTNQSASAKPFEELQAS